MSAASGSSPTAPTGTGKELARVFGVRHLSPAAGLHVRRFLDAEDPDFVLIEGPSDATEQIVHLAHAKTQPPVAILAFTKTRPVRSLVYPLASYSPEWVAARWALEKKRQVRFIDLPASAFLHLHAAEALEEAAKAARAEKEADESGAPAPEVENADAPTSDSTQAYLDDPYEAIAQLTGEVDHETWWERQFEHTREIEAYRSAIFEFGRGLPARTGSRRRAGRGRRFFARRSCGGRSAPSPRRGRRRRS